MREVIHEILGNLLIIVEQIIVVRILWLGPRDNWESILIHTACVFALLQLITKIGGKRETDKG